MKVENCFSCHSYNWNNEYCIKSCWWVNSLIIVEKLMTKQVVVE